MRRSGFFSNWKKIKNVSFGLVYILFILWVIFHTSHYVPDGRESEWLRILIGYGFLNSLILANADLRNKLFNVSLIRFLPRFLMFFIGSLLFFYFVLAVVDPLGESFFTILSNIPLWLAFIHGLVFATTESVVWQGFLDEKIGLPWSSLSAGLFHYGVWTGGAVFVIVSASLLFMFFSFIHWYFRKDKNDLAPVIANHTAFNLVKLGILVTAGSLL